MKVIYYDYYSTEELKAIRHHSKQILKAIEKILKERSENDI